MALFSIILGDFSGDGHSISETFYVNIKDEIDPEILFTNYANNVTEIGFDLSDFANKYEDSRISAAQWNRLLECGMQEWETGDEDDDEEIDSVNRYLTETDLIKIVMFYYTRGLNISWEPFSINATKLTGYYGCPPARKGAGMVGYGLYAP